MTYKRMCVFVPIYEKDIVGLFNDDHSYMFLIIDPGVK